MKFWHKYGSIAFVAFAVLLFADSGWPLFVGGIMLLVFVIEGIYGLDEIRRNGKETTATILLVAKDEDNGPITIVEFELSDGAIIRGKPYISGTWSFDKFSSDKDKEGKREIVIYLPKNPSRFILKQNIGSTLWVLGMTAVMAILVSGLGVCALLGFIHFN